jgi:sugar phosphate permease
MLATATAQGETARTRVATHLLPFLFLLYIANYIDRTNISIATLGMKGDLGLSDQVFGTAFGIFFVGYLALQIPGALLVERWSARRLLAATLITWGALTVMTGLVRSPLQLYGARFLLGAAEAGFFPGVIVYLSHWFIYEDRSKAVARFMSAIPIAFMLGGPIGGKILGVHWLGVTGWRWLFLLEGVPAVVLGIATAFLLPDRPSDVAWLTADERNWLSERLAAERRARANVEHMTVRQALHHGPVVLLMLGLFFIYTSGYAVYSWTPTVLQRFTGWSTERVGWIVALPFAAGLIGMLFIGWNSDRTCERRWHVALPVLSGAAALIVWLLVPQSNAGLVCVLIVLGIASNAYLPAFWSLPSSLLSGSAAAAAIGFINSAASLGGFFGPKVVGNLSQMTGSFRAGFIFMIACWLIGAILVLLCPQGSTRS